MNSTSLSTPVKAFYPLCSIEKNTLMFGWEEIVIEMYRLNLIIKSMYCLKETFTWQLYVQMS